MNDIFLFASLISVRIWPKLIETGRKMYDETNQLPIYDDIEHLQMIITYLQDETQHQLLWVEDAKAVLEEDKEDKQTIVIKIEAYPYKEAAELGNFQCSFKVDRYELFETPYAVHDTVVSGILQMQDVFMRMVH